MFVFLDICDVFDSPIHHSITQLCFFKVFCQGNKNNKLQILKQFPSLSYSPGVAQERETEGDLFLSDIGEGLGFKAGAFDGVISISALQWLCNADKKDHHPPKRLYLFFCSLYACMVSYHIILV